MMFLLLRILSIYKTSNESLGIDTKHMGIIIPMYKDYMASKDCEGQSPTATNTMNYNITKEELLSVPSWREYNPHFKQSIITYPLIRRLSEYPSTLKAGS